MVKIYMARRMAGRKGWLDDTPANLPIISWYPLTLGMLMFNDSYVLPGDPAYFVETLGL